jgi:hypothetical protein
MKTIIVILLSIALIVSFSGCGYRIVKTDSQPEAVVLQNESKPEAVVLRNESKPTEMTVKIGGNRKMPSILEEILVNGEIIDKDVYARNFGEYEYSWERWIIKERTGDYHVVVIENGKLKDIAPINDFEDARRKFQPYGGWEK